MSEPDLPAPAPPAAEGDTTPSEPVPFAGGLAVITGGGDGMGRALAVRLAAAGCSVAICDLSEAAMAATLDAAAPADGVVVSSHRCDVSDEAALEAFRAEIAERHSRDDITLLFNNAGIGGGGSMVVDARATWERAFAVNWGGVYLGTRVFLPALVAADRAAIVNTSSVNGLWASLGPGTPHTSYSAAKFAVRGFTEALLQDLRLHAPHVTAHVVMPGHIGTGIAANSIAAHGIDPDAGQLERAAAFRNTAPTTADEAAAVILAGVRSGRWRILVGDDADVLDGLVRDDPEGVYEPAFYRRLADLGVLGAVVGH